MAQTQTDSQAKSAKIQFATTQEKRDWFNARAKELGITQDELYDLMQGAYLKDSLCAEHPDQASVIATFEALVGQMRDVVAGMAVAVDTSKDVARRECADEMDKVRKNAEREVEAAAEMRARLDEEKGYTDILRRQLADREQERDRAVRRAEELETTLADVRASLDTERRRNDELGRLVEQNADECRDVEAIAAERDQAQSELARMRVELAARDDAIARADAEIAHLRAQVDKLQDRLLGVTR